MDISFPDRRKHPRVVLIAPVEISSATRKHHGIIRNISISGVGIESYEKLDVGKVYQFCFSPGGLLKIKIKGIIKWNRDSENKSIYGAEFVKCGVFNRIKMAILIGKLIKKTIL